MITVQDAMGIGGLTKCKIVAGHKGANREIKHVTVMEVPDTIQWLKGNELLLTSLYPIKDDTEAVNQLVRQLVEKGSAGLAIKTHRFFEQIPEMIIHEANRLNFPVIEMDKDVPYLDIITPLMSAILGNTSLEQEDIDDINDVVKWITELALGGKGLEIIVETLTKILKNLVTIESETPLMDTFPNVDIEPLSREQKHKLKKSQRPRHVTRLLNEQETPTIVAPLILNQEINGYISFWQTEKELGQIDVMILERVIPLIALEFLKVKTEHEVEQKYKNQFLSEVLLGKVKDETEVFDKAKTYGWDLSQDFQVFVLDIDHFNAIAKKLANEVLLQEYKQKILSMIERIVLQKEKSAVVAGWSDMIAVLYPAKAFKTSGSYKEKVCAFASEIQTKIGQLIPEMTFTIGIGRFYPALDGMHLGYQECVQSINLGREVWGRGQIIHFDDLGIYRILSQYQNRKELEDIYQETIGKLVEYDQTHHSHLTETLERYFKQNMNLKETAQSLYIHINTLKYRLQKIEQLTGYSVSSSEGHLHLHLGLKVKRVINRTAPYNQHYS